MLSAHYRSPINFCDELMEAAKNGLERIYNCIDNLEFIKDKANEGALNEEIKNKSEAFRKKFIMAMEDDLW
jgi:cysteinyl-tRNA synthetase